MKNSELKYHFDCMIDELSKIEARLKELEGKPVTITFKWDYRGIERGRDKPAKDRPTFKVGDRVVYVGNSGSEMYRGDHGRIVDADPPTDRVCMYVPARGEVYWISPRLLIHDQ